MTDATSPEKVPSVLTESIKQSVLSTFATICGTALGYQGETASQATCDGVVGIIGIVGDEPFSLMLGLPRATAPALVEKFTGFPIPYDSADMGDMVGEFANFLGGDIVARLETHRVKASISLPTVIRGSNVEMLLPQGQPGCRLAFSSPCGDFWVRVACKRRPTTGR